MVEFRGNTIDETKIESMIADLQKKIMAMHTPLFCLIRQSRPQI